MRIGFRDRSELLPDYLPELKSRPLNYSDATGFRRRTIEAEVPGDGDDLRKCDFGFLFRYDIFPPAVMRFFGEWQTREDEMKEGDVIVQQARFPARGPGVRAIFGVRVLQVWREPKRVGFRYGTLRGHPERGLNDFVFTASDGHIRASIQTRAAAGTLPTRLAAPIVTYPYADYCNRRALERMVTRFIDNQSFGDHRESRSPDDGRGGSGARKDR